MSSAPIPDNSEPDRDDPDAITPAPPRNRPPPPPPPPPRRSLSIHTPPLRSAPPAPPSPTSAQQQNPLATIPSNIPLPPSTPSSTLHVPADATQPYLPVEVQGSRHMFGVRRRYWFMMLAWALAFKIVALCAIGTAIITITYELDPELGEGD